MRIAEARASDIYNTEEQIENLLLLKQELDNLAFMDTLGAVEYFLAMRYRKSFNHEKIIEHATNAIKAYEQSDYIGYRLSFCYNIRCLANKKMGKQKEAMSDALAIEKLHLQGRGFEALGDAVKYQAETFRNNGDFESSISKLNNFFLTDRADSLTTYFKSNLYLELSMAHSNYDDSLSLYKAIEAIDSVIVLIPDIDNRYLYRDKTKIIALSQLGHIYSQFKKWGTAINYYEEALDIANAMSIDLEIDRFRMSSKVNLIELYGKTGQSHKMKRFEGQESELYQQISPLEYAAYYENLATQYRKNDELDNAVGYIEKAKAVLNHPNDKLQIQKFKQRLSTALHEEVETNYTYYLKTNNKDRLQKALHTMATLDSLIDIIGLDLLFESSVFKWRETAKSFYDAGLKVAFANKDVDLFWRYAEKTKGLALLETIIRNQKVERNPEYEKVNSQLISLRKQESEIYSELDSLNDDMARKDKLEEESIKNKNAQLKLYVDEQEKLSKDIPEVITIADIQQQLEDKTLILYANDGVHLYGISVNSQHAEMIQLMPLTELQQKLANWNQYLTREIDEDKEELMLDLLSSFNSLEESIVIIPDEYTRTIPFAALRLENGSFAIEEFRFSYDISATFFHNHHNSEKFRIIRSSIVTPNYTGDKANKLAFTESEGNDIAQVLNANRLSDDQAIKTDVINELSKNDLLHFSGHLNVENGVSSMLLSEKESMSMDDVYHSDSSVKFLFMNACESASGKVLIGEGISNFARSFMQSGSETIIQTLWNVNDYSSAVIGTHFYRELKEGKSVDEAMRSAQLNYLDNADDFARHPYYWASISVLGKTHAVQFDSLLGNNFWTILCVTGIFLLLWYIKSNLNNYK